MSSPDTLGPIDAVVGFPDCAPQVAALANLLGIPREIASVHTSPDGESLVQVRTVARHVAVYRSLHHPNPKLFEVILAASALRDLGAARVTLIAPYLPYMRQDVAFEPGQAVSQRVLGTMFGAAFDGFVTVDPHLHRTHDLRSVFCDKPSLALSAAPAIADRARAYEDRKYGIVVGPDEEAAPFVQAIAERLGTAWSVATKMRHGDRQVTISIPSNADVKDRSVLIADDVISTGTTIAAVASGLRLKGPQHVDVYATHALCDGMDIASLHTSGIDRIVSTDSVLHSTNGIPVAHLIAGGLGQNRGVR